MGISPSFGISISIFSVYRIEFTEAGNLEVIPEAGRDGGVVMVTEPSERVLLMRLIPVHRPCVSLPGDYVFRKLGPS